MDLCKMTVSQLREMLLARKISASELLSVHLERIERSQLNAYITLNDKAMEAAREIDRRIRSGQELPPLAGIPIAVKDNISTKGLRTTCASKMLENYIPPFDAGVVEKLRSAGAVMIGKTNMDEFGMGSSSENSAFGPVRNPRDPSRSAGGSSGGSAAAVCAGEAVLALGTDTGGSVRQPSSMCGVVGIKPTYGSTSRSGLIAFASSLEQVGAIGRTVADAALLQGVISGPDPMDPTCVIKVKPKNSIQGTLSGLRIGVPKELFGEGISDLTKDVVMRALSFMERHGAKLIPLSLPELRYSVSCYYMIASAEAASNLGRYDGIRFGHASSEHSSLAELFRNSRSEGFGREVKRRILLGTYVLSAGYAEKYYRRAASMRAKICSGFETSFSKCHMIASPTATGVAFPLGIKRDDPTELYSADICTVPANLAGLPAISFPCGSGEGGLPIGIQLVGRKFAEDQLFSAAYSFESLSGGYEQLITSGGV